MAQAVHEAAVSRALQSRALDKNFSCTNDLTQPWGLMSLGPNMDKQFLMTLETIARPPLLRLALLYVRRLRSGGLLVLAPVCCLSDHKRSTHWGCVWGL